MSHPQLQSEVSQLSARFARNANARDVDALVRDFYASDAVLLPPNAPQMAGTDAIKAFWKGLLDGGAADVAIQSGSVDSSGDLAYEVGTYSFTMPDEKGGKLQLSGKFVVVYKRQANGSLLAVADMFSPNA
jgi:ketosteroid isomerase-like protein